MDDRVDSDGALVLLLTADDFDFNLDDKKKDDGKMHVIFGKGGGSPRVVFAFAFVFASIYVFVL